VAPLSIQGNLRITPRVGPGDEKVGRPRCATLVHHFGAKYAMPYENNAPILLCRGMVTPLPELWPQLRHID